MPGIESSIGPHDKAVEQRDFAGRSCACLNPAAGQKFEILQDTEEAILPERNVLRFDSRERARDPVPSVRNSMFAHRVIDIPVLGSPHVAGDFACKLVHGFVICHWSKKRGTLPPQITNNPTANLHWTR